MIVWAGAGAAVMGFVLAALATPVTRWLAAWLDMMDLPGRHKAHRRPVPLLGGCAIFVAVAMPSLLATAVAAYWNEAGIPEWVPRALAVHVPGAAEKAPAAVGILCAAALLHVVGLIDDRRHLGPWLKLFAQFGAAVFVVLVCGVEILTVAGPALSMILSVVWIVTITNAFNFLDNMDGLSAGVAVICAGALIGAAASMGQIFVAVWVCLLMGALLGFLPYNFHPASTFMGDAGSLVVGFLLGVLSCMTTYVHPDQSYVRYGMFVPLVLMALPLYDMASVIALRLRDRRNPMVGDRRHFSHRLLRRGMGVRTAVLTIYLCTAATAIAASLLPHVVGWLGATLVFAQTGLILLVLALLEFGDRKL